MRLFRKGAAAGLLLLSAIVLHAGLAGWVQNLAAESGLRGVFFRSMVLPYGAIDGRRPPRETRPALAGRIAAAPGDATLYRLRAGEDELALDFAAAESDWKAYAARAHDGMALADYYHRRAQTGQELAALDAVATPAAFERAVQTAEDDASATAQYRAWIGKFPQDAALRKRFLRYLIEHRQFAAADAELQTYRRAYPEDESVWIEEVDLTLQRAGVEQAIAVFDKAFRPLMPDDWLNGYFDLLDKQGRLREFLAKARTAAAAQPQSLDPVARQFHYYRHEKNDSDARRVLLEYGARKQNWTAGELYATGRLLEEVEEWDEAARRFYALYSLPTADDAARERGLVGIAGVLLNAPEQPVRFGAGDLSLYQDIAAIDPHPGFLNGILSLVLNSESPREEYDRQNQASTAYFHRARASQLLDLLDDRFPHSKDAPQLHSGLIAAYGAYGDDDGVVRAGRKFLAAYPQSFEHYGVALEMGDAFARQDRLADELAVYDALLKDSAADPALQSTYKQVLDRYIARLVALDRTNDALALYRREIDRNPQDQSLYEELAAFLDQRQLGAQVEQVYRQAAARFPDSGWQQKLARWYLRLRRNQDFAGLTRQVVAIFSGTGLEKYFREIVDPASLDAALYRQVNLYAHGRFPDNLTFVRNLTNVYARKETADPEALTRLYRAYWFYDGALRTEFFEAMARTGVLDRHLAAANGADAATNPAAAQFLAEGEAWRCHYEAAAAPMRALAGEFPGDSSLVLRASTLERSLGRTEAAVALARNLVQADPRSTDALARVGDTLADRDLFTRARPYWDRIAQEPGKPDGYLEAATIFWDYYRYDDALRLIGEARSRFHRSDLSAYECGAIYEGKRDYAAAVREYSRGAESESPARDRLLVLASRAKYRALVDAAVSAAPLELRVAVLEAEKRSVDLQALLRRAAAAETSAGALEFVQETAAQWGFPTIQEGAAQRRIALTRDPVERIRLRLALVRMQEAHGAPAAARQTMEAVVRENPASLGVIRAATDFYWRNQLPAEAVATLTAAAGRSNQAYRDQFRYEAARKSTSSRQFENARKLLAPLLAANPFHAQYLAALADTYAEAGDDTGLRDFYTAAIDAMQRAPLAADERSTRIAGLRRGLIPALTRLGRFSDALDQYVELVNRYPEDQGLVHETGTFAARHNLGARLTGYYAKAAADSPKDYRWPLVTARLQTVFENFDAAVAAYTSAIRIRPGRVDLYEARGALEERLMRFADAGKTYNALWELSYRDTRWLDKVAELEARQQRPDAAVATLRKAYLDGRPERAGLLLTVAGKLESWNLVPQALEFARRAGAYDLAREDTAVYARVMTRAREYRTVLDKLPDPRAALPAMAEAVDRYYAPEEKAALAGDLEKRLGAHPDRYWTDFAHQAELFDLEARWRQAGDRESWQLIELQNNRLRFEELGRQLEGMAAGVPPGPAQTGLLAQAAEAYTSCGDAAALERIFGRIPETRRFLQSVAQGDPAKLLRWAGQRDDAADLAMASGDPTVALAAVTARGEHQPPVWSLAYSALASLFYWNTAPDATPVFRQALGGGAIGERLGQAVDRRRQLAGSTWFYYGARFGEYLSLQGNAAAEDYLLSELEASPGRPDAYSGLADWYVERGQTGRAFTEYDHALELDPGLGEVQDRIALLYWDQGKPSDALAHWKLAMADFEAQQGRPNLVDSFWPQAAAALEHIGQHGAAAELRPAVDSLLRKYVARHAGYRTESLVAPIAKYRLLDLSSEPLEVLEPFRFSRDLSPQDKIALLRRWIALNRQRPAAERAYGLEAEQRELVGLLLDAGDLAGARAAYASLRQAAVEPSLNLELRIAARAGELASLLDGYRRSPQGAPGSEALRNAAESFTRRHEDAVANQILEFAYARALDDGDFAASNFLGLAQIRMQAGDPAGAQQLLRRMQLVADQPFEDLLPAADLLERFGRKAEAAEYIQARVRAVPWDAEARLRLGTGLGAMVSDAHAPYQVRVQAARRGATGGEGELALLARAAITPAEADRPFYYEARLAAAQDTPDQGARTSLLRDAIAVHPDLSAPLQPLFQAAYRTGNFAWAREAGRRFWARESLPPEIARELAAVFERAQDSRSAAAVLRMASERAATPEQVREQLRREMAAVERRQQVQQQNEARRPRIGASLEQDHMVRPRIEK